MTRADRSTVRTARPDLVKREDAVRNPRTAMIRPGSKAVAEVTALLDIAPPRQSWQDQETWRAGTATQALGLLSDGMAATDRSSA